MANALDGIDHLIIGVRDLEAARERFARLGFNTTPRGRHVGWGTANYCIMFEDDYLELLGVIDPTQFTNNLDEFLAHGEGLMSVALRSTDAVATHAAWGDAGLAPSAPRDLGRSLDLEDGPVELRFRNVMPDGERIGGLSVFACEHLTPAPMRRPAWLAHPNGAFAVKSCTVVADDPTPVRRALTAIVGSSAVTATDNVIAAHVGRGVLVAAPPEDAGLMHPRTGIDAPAPGPMLRVVTLRVRNRDAAARFLELQGIKHQRTVAGDIVVPAAAAHGTVIELVA